MIIKRIEILNKLVVFCVLLVAAPAFADEVLHSKVQAALDYELPVNICKKPKLITVSSNVTDGEGSRAQTDTDSYTIDRYARKEKRWKACVAEYKEALMGDFGELKSSAQYGLTQTQADIILAKMAFIQSVYITPDARVEDPAAH
jgi:hypothetical protein